MSGEPVQHDLAVWRVEGRVKALDLGPLMSVYEDVEYAHRDRIAAWCYATARRLYDAMVRELDECPDYVWWCRQREARECADKALRFSSQHSSNLRLSSAVAEIVRAWAWIEEHKDPVNVMRLQLLSFHDSAIDALAGLARE